MDIQAIQNLTINHKKLVEARREKNLTQSDVAKALDIDRRKIWQYENGVALPLENFTKMMLFYGKDISYFLD